MDFKYLNSDQTKILFKEVAYSKYRDVNTNGEITWRCPQCKCVTLKTIKDLVLELPSKNFFL